MDKVETKNISPTKGVFAYIDAENIRNAVEFAGYVDLDYQKLFNWLYQKKNVTKMYIYAGIENGDIAKEEHFTKLKKLGFTTKTKKVMAYKQQPKTRDISCPNCSNTFKKTFYINDRKKANCDADMTLDICKDTIRKKCDGILVFSGDGDFVSIYKYVSKELHKPVTVFAPSNTRTSLAVKDLHKDGTIILEDLATLYQHYIVK